MYVITKQSKEQQRYFNQKSKRWFLDKSKATVFEKNIEAQKVAGVLKGACFVINSKNGNKTRKQFSRRGKGENRKVQVPTSITVSNIEKLGGIETVKKILADCIAANLKLVDYSNQI